MLHCNMNLTPQLQLCLEDLVADLQNARRQDDLGRMALLAYCDVRRWARLAGESGIADHSEAIFIESPHVDREAFLSEVDGLVDELVQVRQRAAANG